MNQPDEVQLRNLVLSMQDDVGLSTSELAPISLKVLQPLTPTGALGAVPPRP